MSDYYEKKGSIGRIQAWLAKRKGVNLGSWGEWVALKYLLSRRWDIVVLNWTSRQGELDLIAYDGPDLVFVEVKTRHAPTEFSPESNVDEEKRSHLERLAYSFVERYELYDLPIRFDLIAIETPNLRNYQLRHYSGFM
jgi:putative endonuclease